LAPAKYGWASLLKLDGAELETHYRTVLEELGKKPGMPARSSRRPAWRGLNGIGAVLP